MPNPFSATENPEELLHELIIPPYFMVFMFIHILSLLLCPRAVQMLLSNYSNVACFPSPHLQSFFFVFLFCISQVFFPSACPFVLPRLCLPTVYLTSFPSHLLLSGCHGETLQVCVYVCMCAYGSQSTVWVCDCAGWVDATIQSNIFTQRPSV